MKVTAKPNPMYRWYNNFREVEFFAEVTDGRNVTFHLVENTKIKQVSQQFVREFFPEDKRLKDRPFTRKDNPDFYAVLYRNRKRYHQIFETLLKPKFKRTK